MGRFPSGQREQTVNLLAPPSVVRIHLFPPKKKASKFRCFLFLCEREWMKNRCKATVRTVAYSNGAVVQLVYHCTTQCSVLLFIYELPNAEAIHLFRILWWILNHLFRCWTLRYACKHARSRSYTNPPLSKKSRCCYFLCEREWMRYRVSKPRFAPLRIATAPLRTLLNISLHNAAFCCIFENCPTPRLSTSFEKLRCLFLCWESWILRGFHRAARCA